MPVEVKELVIKALVVFDCENKTVTQAGENIVCLKWPDEKHITNYVSKYFKQRKAGELSFDQPALAAFLLEWQASLLK